jgi:hypothetical protein
MFVLFVEGFFLLLGRSPENLLKYARIPLDPAGG